MGTPAASGHSGQPAADKALAAELERLAPRLGFSHLTGVLLDLGGTTARLDHVVIDRRGVLVIETRDWPGDQIRGASADPSWTVLRAGLAAGSFPNPLRMSDTRSEQLAQAMDAHRIASAGPVKGLVVLGALDAHSLELDADHVERVIALADLEAVLSARLASASVESAATSDDVARLSSAIASLDRSRDPDVVARHAAAAAPAPTVGAPVPVASPARPGLRPWVWPAVAVALVGLLGVVLVVAMWSRPEEAPVVVPTTPPPAPAPAREPTEPVVVEPPSPSVDLANAKRLLRDHASGTYSLIADIDHPVIDRLEDRMLYTWEYLERSGNAVQVHTITLTVRADGSFGGLKTDR